MKWWLRGLKFGVGMKDSITQGNLKTMNLVDFLTSRVHDITSSIALCLL
jgi:hypothetical protein